MKKHYTPGASHQRWEIHRWYSSSLPIIFYLSFLLLSFFSCKKNVNTNPAPEQVEATFQELLVEAIEDSYNQVPGVSMTIIAPEQNITWTGAAGFDSKEKDQKLEAEQPFRIASITKTYVATAIMRLHEMGKLSIDDKIENYISEPHLQILIAGGYAPDSITIRQCLNHTSGLFDYAMGGRGYIDMALNDPMRRWTRTEQLQLAMELGPRVGYPGERYRYNDTGYILLGEIIETQLDSTLGYGLNKLLGFEKLNIKSTWLETIDQEPNGLKDFVHSYFGDRDVSESDPSGDLYGGGGLVSTTVDMAAFGQALFNQRIFNQASTLDLMLEKATYDPDYDIASDRRYKDYRQGLWEINIYGEKAYMHSGLWGGHLLHVPALNCTVAINYTKANGERLMKKAILVIKNLSQKS